MNLKEAIFLQERVDLTKGSISDAPFLNICSTDKFELVKFLLNREDDDFTKEDVKAAEDLFEFKCIEYSNDLNKYIDFKYGFYSPAWHEAQKEKEIVENKEKGDNLRAGLRELKSLTDLSISISKIGSFNINELGIYEANRIILIDMLNSIKSAVSEVLGSFKASSIGMYEDKKAMIENLGSRYDYIDIANHILETVQTDLKSYVKSLKK